MQGLTDSLEVFLSKTPLERFALYFASQLRRGRIQGIEANARKLFDSYDSFLGLLNDEEKRDHLEKLNPQDEFKSGIFLEARKLRHDFRLAMQDTFTEPDSPLREHTLSKGIF